jgi:GH18 family chitinase
MKIRSQMNRFVCGISHAAGQLSRQQRRSLERRRQKEPRPSLVPESLEARALLAVVVPGYEVTQDWGSGFQGSLTLENRDVEAVENWTVSFDYDADIGSIWDAKVVSRDGDRYTISNAGWNGTLAPGRSVSFGFIGSGDTTAPTNYTINGEPIDGVAPPADDPPTDNTGDEPTQPLERLSAILTVVSDWGTGFTGDVKVSNAGDTPLEGWTVTFDFAGEIGSLWNGEIVSRNGSTYTVRGASWNSTVPAEGSVNFGFNATPGGEAAVFENIVVSGIHDSPAPDQPPPDQPPLPDPDPGSDPVAPPTDPGDGGQDDTLPVDDESAGLNSGNLGDEKWGEAYFAPYVDMGLWPVPDLSAIAEKYGTSLLTLGFLQAAPDGMPAWAGIAALAPDSDFPQAIDINASIDAFQAAGGDVMISLGGAAGTSLAQAAVTAGRSADDLAAAYLSVVERYSLSRLDFDIEGAAVAEPRSIALRSEAIRLLQQQRPDLEVWYTLPVLPTGLTADGLNVVRSALEAGVKLDGVNVMAMDYGESAAPTSGPNARTMGAYAIAAAENTHAQLSRLFAEYDQGFNWRMVGVTPMIGVNDVLTEVFTVDDAQALEDFAREKSLGMLSMWSVARDKPGSLGQATATASGLDVAEGSFSAVFNDYGTINELDLGGGTSPVDPGAGDPGGDPATDPGTDPGTGPVDDGTTDPGGDPGTDPTDETPPADPPADPGSDTGGDTGGDTGDDPVVDVPASDLAIASYDGIIAAYFPEWGIYGRNYQLDDVPGDKINRLIYAFANLTAEGEVTLFDSYAAVDKRFGAHESVSGEADQWYYPPEDPRSQQTIWGNFNQLAQLKEKFPHLRTSIAIGGWTLSTHFSTVSSTEAGRQAFADSIVDFLTTYTMFDGVDFDWEYPGGGGLASNSVSPNDGANYALLLEDVREHLDVLEDQTGRVYEISVASPAGIDKIANFNLEGLTPSVDYYNLMAYDFHGTWENTTGHQAAFTGDPDGYDIKTAVNAYLDAGVPREKIVLGAPLYTRGWSGVADGGDGGYDEAASGGAPGTFEKGVYDYKDLLAQVQDPNGGWQLYWDDVAQASYVYNAKLDLFSSFETPTSIALKAQWVQEMGLGGMMFWDLTNDATDSPESLITAAFRSLVLEDDFQSIRESSSLRNEVIIGGDGEINPWALI